MNNTNYNLSSQEQPTQNQILNILSLLWVRFKRQRLQGKLITLCFLLLTILTAVLFFSTLLIWMCVKYILIQGSLNLTEWYLKKTHIDM